jgi:cardiolipin synthase
MVRRLEQAGIRAAAFLSTHLPRLYRYTNLRNHRKILVVDGAIGFTGGMNIRESHWLALGPAVAACCLHFRVTGPVVADLQRTFAVDWAFSTGEHLHAEEWFPQLGASDTVVARGVPDGPDADLDNIPHLSHGALSAATRAARIVTPYFLPDGVLLRALQVAAMRGVGVDIVLPSKSNVPIMDWAMAPQFPELLDKSCRIYLTPPPFDHTKLLVVDGFWSLIGSTNWDARSLRLNFEYNLECYDAPLARRLEMLVDAKIANARRIEAAELRARPFATRLRDGLARLLSPYL